MRCAPHVRARGSSNTVVTSPRTHPPSMLQLCCCCCCCCCRCCCCCCCSYEKLRETKKGSSFFFPASLMRIIIPPYLDWIPQTSHTSKTVQGQRAANTYAFSILVGLIRKFHSCFSVLTFRAAAFFSTLCLSLVTRVFTLVPPNTLKRNLHAVFVPPYDADRNFGEMMHTVIAW